MNERFQELVEEANLSADKTYQFDPKDGFQIQEWDKFRLEKFAELIVKECIGCCEQVIGDPVPESVDTWLDGGLQCIAEIKQHFGVEE